MEVCLRRAQLSELKHKQKQLRGSDDDMDVQVLYSGLGEARWLVMIAPLLSDFVATETCKETSVVKEQRKLREERQLAWRPKKKGDGKGGGDAAASKRASAAQVRGAAHLRAPCVVVG